MVPVLVALVVGGAIELVGLVYMGDKITTMNTVSLIMLTFLIGIIVGRGFGKEWFDKIQWHLRSGTLAPNDVVNGTVMYVGSLLLITPGPVTDILGLLTIIPQTRFIAKNILTSFMKKRIELRKSYFFFNFN